MTDFEKQKADALDAVRSSKCVGKYIQVPVEHMATITKALQPVAEVEPAEVSDLRRLLKAFRDHVAVHATQWDDAVNGSHHNALWGLVADAINGKSVSAIWGSPIRRQRTHSTVCRLSWVQGFACCLANAVELESFSPRDIGGGMKIEDFEAAGVEEYDLNRLRAGWEK